MSQPFSRPVFILAAPRSGSTLLFETLSQVRDVWTIGGESHGIFEGIPQLRPGAPGVQANRLTATLATTVICEQLKHAFLSQLMDRDQQPYDINSAATVRLLEKTPKNALRVPFLNAVFPDAMFIYLCRDPAPNISSIMEAWRAGNWVTYGRLPGWDGPWSLLLPPGWREMIGRPLVDVAAFQWERANTIALDDLEQVDRARWISVRYEDLVDDPCREVERLCRFAGLETDAHLQRVLQDTLPLSRYTLTPPSKEKWRRNEIDINRVLPGLAPVVERINRCF